MAAAHTGVAAAIAKQRAQRQEAFERAASELTASRPVVTDLAAKFLPASHAKVDAAFSQRAVGLLSAEELKAAREEVERAARIEAYTSSRSCGSASGGDARSAAKLGSSVVPAKAGTKRAHGALSFTVDECDDDADGDASARSRGRAAHANTSVAAAEPTSTPNASSANGVATSAAEGGAAPAMPSAPETANGDARAERAAVGVATQTNDLVEVSRVVRAVRKDPTVPTGFLPDIDRDRSVAHMRERLREEWMAAQEAVKQEKLEIVYSYWDGTGHRRSIEVAKGTTIGRFLEWVRQDLCGDFPALRSLAADGLMYVKEDLIIPHTYSFYDLIITRARGKSGPLFVFGVKEDVRLRSDARLEKDESHPGKIVERRWYERNKHIFPASRWEIYDPSRRWDDYTTHGREVV